MLAADLFQRLSAIPFLLIGVAILAWNRRLARASVASDRAAARALESKTVQRVLDKREGGGWYPGFIRAFIVVLGVFFVVVSVVGLVFGPTA